jgi:hypothetical protein
VFRSRRREVVYPQAEHARLSAAIAAAWGNDDFPPPALPFESFVLGVALHDRGYGELDVDAIGDAREERWLELQRRGFEPRGEDPVADLVAALHVRRLVSYEHTPARDALGAEMDAALPALHAAAGVSEDDAAEADRIVALCDAIAFDYAFERPASGSVEVQGASVEFGLDGEGGVSLSPWPLAAPRLVGVVVAYRAEGYPERLDPVVETFRVEPAR